MVRVVPLLLTRVLTEVEGRRVVVVVGAVVVERVELVVLEVPVDLVALVVLVERVELD